MRPHNFNIINGDTDSIMFCKPDMSPFTKKEQESLILEINNLLPKEIKFANDGIFKRAVILKAKNYVMIDENGKRKVKGSALKSSTLEPALKTTIQKMVDCLIENKQEELPVLYLDMIRNIRDRNIDIKQWAKKMQLSPTTFNSTRTNETKVIDAIKGTEYKSGDRIYVYAAEGDILKLVEHYNNDYDQEKMYSKVFKATQRFATILPVKDMFFNYSLKKNKKLLESL